MATTPTTPTMPCATAATPRGRRGRMTFSVQRLPEPLLLEQAVLDPTWNTFKTIMVFVGGFLFFLVFGILMFTLGVVGRSSNIPASAPSAVGQSSVGMSAPAPSAQASPLPSREPDRPQSVWSLPANK